MIPPLVDLHFQSFKERVSQEAHLVDLSPKGQQAAMVVVPDVKLPSGWNKPTTTVRFLVTHAYPVAQLDCFWTDFDLRLFGDRPPQNTAVNPIPGVSEQFLWFSWHPQAWDPNRSTMTSYFRVICDRLARIQ